MKHVNSYAYAEFYKRDLKLEAGKKVDTV